jgi:hypothetical protein
MRIFLALTLLATTALHAASPEAEKTFLEAYRKAYEAGNLAALHAFLHTDGAPSEIVEVYRMMQTPVSGGKLQSITLTEISPERRTSLTRPTEMPDGRRYKLPCEPYKLLVVETTPPSGGKAKSTVAVAEVNGRLVIPVPVPAR